ncbi:MAG: hypothetical protein H0V17_14630 [Deltaproteobacteria bacterium]|nr:hypothetical protein [Deltaproteobacteria bacterium]
MKVALVFVVACSGGGVPPTTGSGSGTPPATSGPCEGARAKVEQLYRTEAEAKEPKHVDGAVADNTQMVMIDCAKEPAKVAACINSISTIAELEAKCLRPIDDEGTEGTELK